MSQFRGDFVENHVLLARGNGCLDAPNFIPAGGTRCGQWSPFDFYRWGPWAMTVLREVSE